MSQIRIPLLIEISLIILYFLITIFSITIQPFNLILGYFIIIILPGYNLISLLKPAHNFMEKIGYAVFLSLAIESILIIISYIVLYNNFTYPESTIHGFKFNSFILITSILFINLVLIIIKELMIYKKKPLIYDKFNLKNRICKIYDLKIILRNSIILLIFVLSLAMLCVSTYFSNVPNNDYETNYQIYRSDFTFFKRVPLIFYFFLFLSIISFIYILITFRKSLIILICTSIMIYCLWILPYIQIGNYFSHDTYFIAQEYDIYLNYGIYANGGYNFVIFNFDTLRYSTGILSTILLIASTGVNVNFALWYLYPLLYIFVPFLFYMTFKKFSNKSKSSNFISIIFMLFIVFTPQFIKYGHATGTGVIGILVYFILVLELYNLIQERRINFKNSLLIIILYFFLCLTHTEECIYFLVLMIISYIYYLFTAFRKLEKSILKTTTSSHSLLKETIIFKNAIDIELTEKKIQQSFIRFGFLFLILILIFYFVSEFFGYIPYYLSISVGRISYLDFIIDGYYNYLIRVPFFLRGNYSYSTFILYNIISGTFLFLFIIYILFFKIFKKINGLYNIGIIYLKKIGLFLKKIISKPIAQVVFIISTFLLIIYLDQFILSVSIEISIISILLPVLSYFFLILQIFLFIKGIEYYELRNNRQNFFLLSIFSSSIVMIALIAVGDPWLAVYVFHTKFSSYFVFFNLLIIQNTYFQTLEKRNKKLVILIIILTIILGLFYSLRKLRFG